ncbi:MAG TPA: 6,7-dimethyl-8-ribityllumazine synthase [Alphaproteobacteria bacterium]|jgi:6,7-dimethyl-8-ribityllumazine synthase|nr:6,7-dimethyl-8-ribityllumazine synthase [Alphaproteobacteria bacterium]
MNYRDLRILLIEAPYYEDIAAAQLDGAMTTLDAVAKERQVQITTEKIKVPGALEIPAAIKFSLEGRWDGYVVLGCVIRGETSHYDIVCNECARGVQNLAIEHGLAVGFGVLTVEDEEQAWVRAKRSEMNKGGEAAKACLEMIDLRDELRTL